MGDRGGQFWSVIIVAAIAAVFAIGRSGGPAVDRGSERVFTDARVLPASRPVDPLPTRPASAGFAPGSAEFEADRRIAEATRRAEDARLRGLASEAVRNAEDIRRQAERDSLRKAEEARLDALAALTKRDADVARTRAEEEARSTAEDARQRRADSDERSIPAGDRRLAVSTVGSLERQQTLPGQSLVARTPIGPVATEAVRAAVPAAGRRKATAERQSKCSSRRSAPAGSRC